MLTTSQLHEKIASGLHLLDGATGSNLRKAGMPREACTESWVLSHPDVLMDLDRKSTRLNSSHVT